MSLKADIQESMKTAMKAKDQDGLRTLRAIKSQIMLAETESGSKEEVSDDRVLKIIMKMIKQRKDSIAIYQEQNRTDLADPEEREVAILEKFLPAQLSDQELETRIKEIIEKTGASSMKDMGKVMGMANKELAGKAEAKRISAVVKSSLS